MPNLAAWTELSVFYLAIERWFADS